MENHVIFQKGSSVNHTQAKTHTRLGEKTNMATIVFLVEYSVLQNFVLK